MAKVQNYKEFDFVILIPVFQDDDKIGPLKTQLDHYLSTKENLHKLKSFDYQIIGPEIGDMACGEYGEGKMTEPMDIINYIDDYLKNIKILLKPPEKPTTIYVLGFFVS